ncbi:putative Ubiquitin-conjugating enzyme E2 T [Blattamonas nauphoetae]|uniref:Ubiquitin-conjugating enzyme E2 T n=1 Tax=Blattamonas nauphoetae TaxID=2049346 RepID=A0ABQ9XLM9_9EUKA|nr:putative Ubiquitin-conjugating enzyme E2 T [Blattamonas nauphoetae]
MLAQKRVQKELKAFTTSPPPLCALWQKGERINELEAVIEGPEQTPYEGGFFYLTISCPDNYPFAPPVVRFITPIFHPNIDSNGRICLDILDPPPKGSWSPSQNLSTILISLRVLLSDANPTDPLDMEAVFSDPQESRIRRPFCRIKMESVHFRNGMLNKISNGIHPNYLDLGMMSNKEVSLTYLPFVRLDEQVRLVKTKRDESTRTSTEQTVTAKSIDSAPPVKDSDCLFEAKAHSHSFNSLQLSLNHAKHFMRIEKSAQDSKGIIKITSSTFNDISLSTLTPLLCKPSFNTITILSSTFSSIHQPALGKFELPPVPSTNYINQCKFSFNKFNDVDFPLDFGIVPALTAKSSSIDHCTFASCVEDDPISAIPKTSGPINIKLESCTFDKCSSHVQNRGGALTLSDPTASYTLLRCSFVSCVGQHGAGAVQIRAAKKTNIQHSSFEKCSSTSANASGGIVVNKISGSFTLSHSKFIRCESVGHSGALVFQPSQLETSAQKQTHSFVVFVDHIKFRDNHGSLSSDVFVDEAFAALVLPKHFKDCQWTRSKDIPFAVGTPNGAVEQQVKESSLTHDFMDRMKGLRELSNPLQYMDFSHIHVKTKSTQGPEHETHEQTSTDQTKFEKRVAHRAEEFAENVLDTILEHNERHTHRKWLILVWIIIAALSIRRCCHHGCPPCLAPFVCCCCSLDGKCCCCDNACVRTDCDDCCPCCCMRTPEELEEARRVEPNPPPPVRPKKKSRPASTHHPVTVTRTSMEREEPNAPTPSHTSTTTRSPRASQTSRSPGTQTRLAPYPNVPTINALSTASYNPPQTLPSTPAQVEREDEDTHLRSGMYYPQIVSTVPSDEHRNDSGEKEVPTVRSSHVLE